MRQMRMLAGAMPAVLLLTACGGDRGAQAGPLATLKDSTSYAIGVSLGGAVRAVRDSVELEQVIRGLRDAVERDKAQLDEQHVNSLLQRFSMSMQAMEAQNAMRQANENSEKGATYRKENGARKGVTTTSSGLQYEVLHEGTGASPKATDRVTVHYRGTLIDGKEFDSSYGGEPATFPANGVIAGWTEALQRMRVGGKYRLVIPPELAYGQRGAGPDIGPNATLVFEVELLAIAK